MSIKRRSLGRVFMVLLVMVVLIGFLSAVKAVLTPFVLGFILAYLFDPLVDYFQAWKIPRGIGILLSYLFLVLIVWLSVFYTLPIVFRDLGHIAEDIPAYAMAIQDSLWRLETTYQKFPIPEGVRVIIDGFLVNLQNIMLGVIQTMARGLIALLPQTFNIVLAPILSYYFLKEFKQLGALVLKALPVRWQPEIAEVGGEINQVIKKFIRGNLLVALLVGVMTFLGMVMIGMDFPLLIGILVGVTNVIPYFGAFISAVPVLLLALVQSKWLALYALGVLLVVQQIEGNIISPKIIGQCVGLHPLVVIFALLSGGRLWGLLGLLLAVPAAAVLKILGQHLYRRLA